MPKIEATATLQPKVSKPLSVKDYVKLEAFKAGIDPGLVDKIVSCESGYNPLAIGDHGTSHGLWQIHLPAHKDITKEQAHDVVFSTAWSLAQLKKGNAKIWSCYFD